jgi:hypothetical protein
VIGAKPAQLSPPTSHQVLIASSIEEKIGNFKLFYNDLA